jgi:hypothetical protein
MVKLNLCVSGVNADGSIGVFCFIEIPPCFSTVKAKCRLCVVDSGGNAVRLNAVEETFVCGSTTAWGRALFGTRDDLAVYASPDGYVTFGCIVDELIYPSSAKDLMIYQLWDKTCGGGVLMSNLRQSLQDAESKVAARDKTIEDLQTKLALETSKHTGKRKAEGDAGVIDLSKEEEQTDAVKPPLVKRLHLLAEAPLTGLPLADLDAMIETTQQLGLALTKQRKAASTCSVCLDKPATMMNTACRHRCLCPTCADKIEKEEDKNKRKCPVCRTDVSKMEVVYM